MAAAACPFQYPDQEELLVDYSFLLNIFGSSISFVALQKQKTIDNCVRDGLSDIASLSKRYFRYSKSFTDIKQSPTIRISPRAHYHWRQHLLKVLQRYVSMLLAVTKSPLQKYPPCPEFAINEMLRHLLRNSAGHTCIAYILHVQPRLPRSAFISNYSNIQCKRFFLHACKNAHTSEEMIELSHNQEIYL